MDSDCLVKLTKAGAKEVVLSAMEVYIPYLVKKETVDEARGRGYQDTFMIEENIEKKILHLVEHQKESPLAFPASKGEKEVVSLYLKGGYDAIASDDRRFLRKLEAANIPYLTPTACLLYLYNIGRLEMSKASELLEGLKPLISNEEYTIARFYLEGKR